MDGPAWTAVLQCDDDQYAKRHRPRRQDLWQVFGLLPRGPGVPRRGASPALPQHHDHARQTLFALVRIRDQMTVYVALLRAIGPVSHATMRPAALRDKAEEAGFTDPVNYLATGNLIFGSSKSVAVVKTEITALVESFGLTTSEVFIATRAQIKAVVDADPFPAASKDHPTSVGVCFFHTALDWPAALLHPTTPEKVAAVGSAVVIDYGKGITASKLHVEKLTGAKM